MKKTVRPFTAKAIALCLAVLMLSACLASCSSSGKALLTLDKDGTKVSFPVNYYEFMLSRMKGALVYQGYTANGADPTQDKFWDYKDTFGNEKLQTLNDYYGQLILDNCKTYTVVLWYFEHEGLSLTKEQLDSVDKRLDDAIKDHGKGSKTKLNSILSNFGINYKMLRDIFILEEKVKTVQNTLYGADASLLGHEVKEDYLNKNYVYVKQIFLPYFRNVYEKDKDGNEIYYVKESQTKSICYDTSKFAGVDKNGAPITDSNGDRVYYTSKEQTRIAYDMEKGVRSYVLDKNGVATTEKFTPEEINKVKERGNKLFDEVKAMTPAQFEEAMRNNNVRNADNSYNPLEFEYYLQKNIDYASVDAQFSYLTDIVKAIDSVEVGQVCSVTSDNSGYHIVMKYAPVEGAYDDKSYEVWFRNFKSSLVEKIFLDQCAEIYPEISVDAKVAASAVEIRNVGVNNFF